MHSGLVYENGELYYYQDGKPKHMGAIKVDGAIYYIGSGGKAVRGEHIVHGEMCNGILKRGTYTFGEDYKLIKGSYIAPKKKRKKRKANRTLRGKTWNAIRKSLKKKKNRVAIGAAVVLVALIVVLSQSPHWFTPGIHRAEEGTTTPAKGTEIVGLPDFEDNVLLCSNEAKLEYDGKLPLKDAVKTGDPYRPLYFQYDLKYTSGTLLLGEKEDLSDARIYPLEAGGKWVAVHNLKTDTTYHFKVIVDGREHLGTLHTAQSTRFVSIPGLENTRDIGGYVNLDGKKVRQGLVIRGVEPDGLANAPYFIPEDDLKQVQEEFGFRYEMDLRSDHIYNGVYTPRLGVPHKFYDAPMYGGIFTETYRESLRNIFADLADPEKYPMYLHCTWGTDRTGTVVFLLQGVLNLSEEDMRREYMLTGYTNEGVLDNPKIDVIISGIEPYEGNTLQEKIVSFLVDYVGVTEDEIASIREIYLEK